MIYFKNIVTMVQFHFNFNIQEFQIPIWYYSAISKSKLVNIQVFIIKALHGIKKFINLITLLPKHS